MNLATALVLIFILYLIDKHNRWRTAGLIVLSIAVLSVGAFFGYSRYQNHKQTAVIAVSASTAPTITAAECLNRFDDATRRWPETINDCGEPAYRACIAKTSGQLGPFDSLDCAADSSSRFKPHNQ